MIIREYVPEDRSRCVDMAVEAWPILTSGLPHSISRDYWGMLIDIGREYSDWWEVASLNNRVAAFAFGRTRGEPSFTEDIALVRVIAGAMFRMLKKGSVFEIVPLLCRSVITELKIMLKTPENQGELAFLVVESESRGKGIGSTLMNRYLDQARRKHVKKVALFTTDPECDWGFYEAMGFRKVSVFDDDVGAFYGRIPSKGMIFAIDL